MVVIKLECKLGHNFEGWFKNTSEYKRQLDVGLVECPHCGVKMTEELTTKLVTPSVENTSFVSNQEIKMISEQFSSDATFHIKSPFEINRSLLDSVQKESKEFSEDGVTATIQYESIDKDKLN